MVNDSGQNINVRLKVVIFSWLLPYSGHIPQTTIPIIQVFYINIMNTGMYVAQLELRNIPVTAEAA